VKPKCIITAEIILKNRGISPVFFNRNFPTVNTENDLIMNYSWTHLYCFVFLGGLAASIVLTPVFQFLAVKLDFMDRPRGEAHKAHQNATPLLGGAAMFCAWSLCIGVGFLMIHFHKLPAITALLANHAAGVFSIGPRAGFLVTGALLAMLLGLIDDRHALKANTKFLGQFIIALIAVFPGEARLSLFCGIPGLGIAVTVFWYMLLMNSINFFDNMDGLAAGTITIAMMLFAAIAGMNDQFFVAVFTALSGGVCAGFWFYNHAPATIFMGDSGSHFLGYLAATVSVLVTYFRLDQSLSRFPILLPLFILAVPLFDTLMVVLIRIKMHKPFWIGDHNHISHRFVKMGLSRKRAVDAVHLLALAVGLGAFPILWGTFQVALVVVIQAIVLFGLISFLQFSLAEK